MVGLKCSTMYLSFTSSVMLKSDYGRIEIRKFDGFGEMKDMLKSDYGRIEILSGKSEWTQKKSLKSDYGRIEICVSLEVECKAVRC